MIIEENNKKYKCHICDTKDKIDFMISYIENFILTATKHSYVGIDFEFNRIQNERKIALCQLNLESKDHFDIFMFYPPDLKNNKAFVNLLINPKIIKILHGGESLDIPYLFSEILSTQKEREDFSINMFDTKYMCEYYNLSNNLSNNKYKIYKLLLQMNIITIDKFNELEDNDKKMGNIWEINITPNNMSKRVIIYCLYDVIYLPELYKAFPRNKIYLKLLPAINNYNMIMRYNEEEFKKLYSYISSFNTNIIIIEGNKYTFQDVYITIYYWLNSYEKLYYLFQINYFKKIFEMIIKNCLYQKINDEYKNCLILNNIMRKFEYTLNVFISYIY